MTVRALKSSSHPTFGGWVHTRLPVVMNITLLPGVMTGRLNCRCANEEIRQEIKILNNLNSHTTANRSKWDHLLAGNKGLCHIVVPRERIEVQSLNSVR